MERHKPRTYNELIFNSFERERNRKKAGEKDVKLNRIKAKIWCGRGSVPIKKR